MSNIKNLIGLDGISHYAAPHHKKVFPHTIEKEFEIIEIITSGTVYFNDKPCRKGSIFWHIPGDKTIYQSDPEDPYRCMVFRFNMNPGVKRTIQRVSNWINTKDMDVFFQQALHFYHAGQFDKYALAQYIYSRLYWEVMQEPDMAEANNKKIPLALQRAVSYVNRFIGHSYSVEDLARYSRVSKPHLFVLFKENLNTSPHKYITSTRINSSLSMLAGSDKSIKEIALECGFDSIATFYRIFKKYQNVSPAVYRENHNPYQQL